MRIDEVSLYAVDNRLIVPFSASSHAARELTHVVVRMRSGDRVGWGECATPSDPYYLNETAKTAWHVLEDFLVPAVLGKELETVEGFASLWADVRGNTFAKAGLEMAAWDLLGRATGRSIRAMLGGTRTELLSGVAVGIERDLGGSSIPSPSTWPAVPARQVEGHQATTSHAREDAPHFPTRR